MIEFAEEKVVEKKQPVILKNGATFKTKKDALQYIKEKILADEAWLNRSIIALYSRQEPDEKCCRDTLYNNKMGFNAWHSYAASAWAEKLKRGERLTIGEARKAKGIMIMYRKQLLSMAIKR